MHELAGRFPLVDAVAIEAARDALTLMPARQPAGDRRPRLAGVASLLDRLPRPWVALVHHPLALETGLGSEEADALAAVERRVLAAAARVIVTSPQTRVDLMPYDVAEAGSASCCPAPSPRRSPAAPAARESRCSASPR